MGFCCFHVFVIFRVWKIKFLALQQLSDDGLEEAHVLRSAHRKSIEAKVTNHLRYRFKWATELAENVLAGVVLLLDSHVHEALGAPIEDFKLINSLEGKSTNLLQR